MLQKLRDKIGTAGLIVGTVALIAALTGGAYAASGGLTGKQKKQVEGIAKKYAGKPGATGAPGVPGPIGPQGAQGTKGAQGGQGVEGPKGEDGADGLSVLVTQADGVTQCAGVGGAVVEVESKPGTAKPVCNGAEGPEGPEGSPWMLGGTLPSGKTETGSWAFSAPSDETEIRVPISFNIPLPGALFDGSELVHFSGESIFGNFCHSGASTPSADPGHLCVYQTTPPPSNASVLSIISPTENPLEPLSGIRSAGRTGAVLYFENEAEEGELARGAGTWAVTAP